MMDMQKALIDGGNKATDDCGQILKWMKVGYTDGWRLWMDIEMYEGRDIYRQIIVDGYRKG
jgi:hypothetical protein